MDLKLKKIIMTALIAALACVATMSIRIPTPGTQGYIHPGDAIVILSGAILGPAYGLLAGGIGSALADLLGGYFIYVPITFAVKGMIAFVCGLIYRHASPDGRLHHSAVALGGIVDILFVAGGYFLCEAVLYGPAGAAASVLPNLIQGVSGLAISLLLYPVLMKIPNVRSVMMELKHAKH